MLPLPGRRPSGRNRKARAHDLRGRVRRMRRYPADRAARRAPALLHFRGACRGAHEDFPGRFAGSPCPAGRRDRPRGASADRRAPRRRPPGRASAMSARTPSRSPAGDIPSWAERLVLFLDDGFEVPGTKFRVGFDAVLGLIPGVGDLVMTVSSLSMLWLAFERGASKPVIARMLVNIGV